LCGPNELLANIFLAGGGTTKDNIRIEDNCFYFTPSAKLGGDTVGAEKDDAGGSVIIRNNRWAGGATALAAGNWNTPVFTGNTVYGEGGLLALNCLAEQDPARYEWNANTYFGAGSFFLKGAEVNWNGWKKTLDRKSSFTPGRPKGAWIMVQPNKYEPGRAHDCINNWDLKDTVEVDLSNSGLKPGDAFEVRDAQNFFSKPVAAGSYYGKPVSVPMTGLTIAPPLPNIPARPKHTAPEFGAFVVIKK